MPGLKDEPGPHGREDLTRADMFQRRTTFGGGFNAVAAKVVFSGFRSGLALENVNVNYQQQIVRLWDLDGDSGNVYLVANHPQGNASIGKAIGPRAISTAFYERYGDVCRASENNLMVQAKTGCISNTAGVGSQSGHIRLAMSGVVIAGVGVQITANNPVMRQNMNLTFVALDWDEKGNN